MLLEKAIPVSQERAMLVGVECPGESQWDLADSLRELEQLVKSAGGTVFHKAIQKLPAPTAPFYIGKGKAEELAKITKEMQLGTVVFDDELSPAQGRNLEKMFGCKVLDRTQLILDIFAQRAKTREGKLQIELAQLKYLLPRLTRMWTHLSRQSGGIGTRGPGETQLEVDRRRVQEKITKLLKELVEVRRHRGIQRQGRQRHEWPMIALVGYTNAGKSTLLNSLTASEVLAADQLFATLDPTTRKTTLPNKQSLLLSDTVGFLQKLPTHLVESFKATLEEVKEADILLHVVDLSHPLYENQMKAVHQVLGQLECSGKEMITVFNKIDVLENPGLVDRCLIQYPQSVAISAATGVGIDQLFQEIVSRLRARRREVNFRIPQEEASLIAEIYKGGQVLETTYRGNYIHIKSIVSEKVAGRLKEYIKVTSKK